MDISIYMKGDYEDFNALKTAKNKANSKPIAGLRPEIQSTKFGIIWMEAKRKLPKHN